MKKCLLFIFVILSHILSAQIDSLDSVAKYQTGIDRINTLNDLSFDCWVKTPILGVKYGNIALNEAICIKYKLGEADAYNSIGVNLWVMEEFIEAEELFEKARDIYYDIKNKGIINSKTLEGRLIPIMNNLLGVYRSLNQHERVDSIYMQTLDLEKEIGVEKIDVYLYINMAVFYIGKERFSRANELLDKALIVSDANSDEYNISDVNFNKAWICLLKKEYKKGIEYALFSLVIRENIKADVKIVESLILLAELYMNTNRSVEALPLLNRAIIQAEALDLLTDKMQALSLLASYSEKNKDYKNAFENVSQITVLKDSVAERKSREYISSIIIKEEYFKHKEKNFLLEKDSQIRDLKIANNKLYMYLLLTVFLVLLFLACSLIYMKNKSKKVGIDIDSKIKRIDSLDLRLNEAIISIEDFKRRDQRLLSILEKNIIESSQKRLEFIKYISESSYTIDNPEFIKNLNSLYSELSAELLVFEDIVLWLRLTNYEDFKLVKKSLYNLVQNCRMYVNTQLELKQFTLVNKVDEEIYVSVDEYSFQILLSNIIACVVNDSQKAEITISYRRYIDKDSIIIESSEIAFNELFIYSLFVLDKDNSIISIIDDTFKGLGMLISLEIISKYNGKIIVEGIKGESVRFIIEIPICRIV